MFIDQKRVASTERSQACVTESCLSAEQVRRVRRLRGICNIPSRHQYEREAVQIGVIRLRAVPSFVPRSGIQETLSIVNAYARCRVLPEQ